MDYKNYPGVELEEYCPMKFPFVKEAQDEG